MLLNRRIRNPDLNRIFEQLPLWLLSQSPRAHTALDLALDWLYHTVQKDSRGVLGTSFRFGPTSEILENIQYGGSSVVKTDSQRSRFIAREA